MTEPREAMDSHQPAGGAHTHGERTMRTHSMTVTVACLACLVGCGGKGGGVTASDDAGRDGGVTADAGGEGASDAGAGGHCPGYDPNTKNVYWGNLHQHTAYSADAYLFGTRATPADAYTYAKGGAPMPGNQKGTLKRPLDFLAITDHSEWLAYTQGCGVDPSGSPFVPNSPLASTSTECKQMQSRGGLTTLGKVIGEARAFCEGTDAGAPADAGPGGNPGYQGVCAPLASSGWQGEQAATNAANDPCTFTAFNAYEWTYGEGGSTLHKNVIFASDKVPALPFDSQGYPSATSLWDALDQGCTSADGCDVLTVPHNSNLSNGQAFEIPATDPKTLAQMANYQRMVEIHQEKGNSECTTQFESDPNCDFETAYNTNAGKSEPKGYVRAGLSAGLDQYAISKTNPLEMGIWASMDDHHSSPGMVDPQQYATWDVATKGDDLANPGGLAGVWAEENTREAIFAAFKRRETFGTSGPRIAVRFFQVWSDQDFCDGRAFPASVLAAGGVTMGSEMPPRPAGVTGGPWLVVSALMDQAPLAEVDFVRGTGGGAPASVTPVPVNSPGAPCVRWQDQNYSDAVPTYYYARVLETPTWRWTHYVCQAEPTHTGCGAGSTIDVQVKQRAWSSPIWRLP